MNAPDQVELDKVRKVIARTFKLPLSEVTSASALGKLPGWDSVGHIQLMMEMEMEFDVRFPTEKINQPQSAEQICNLVNEVKGK